MTRITAAVLAILFSLAAFADPHEDVDALLSRMHEASKNADVAYFDLFADDAVFFGTDLWERWTKDEFEALYTPYMESGRGWEFKMRDRRIDVQPCGTIALFDEALFSESYGPCRGSGAARLDEGEWRIVRYHLDITIPNAVVDQVVPVIKEYETSRVEVLATSYVPSDLNATADTVRAHLPDVAAFGDISKRDLARLAENTDGYEAIMLPPGGLGLRRVISDTGMGVLYRSDRFDRESVAANLVLGDAPDSEWYRLDLVRRGESRPDISLGSHWQLSNGNDQKPHHDIVVWSTGDPYADKLRPVLGTSDNTEPSMDQDAVIHAQFMESVDEFEIVNVGQNKFHRAIIRFNTGRPSE